jgi:hypothetical protein
MDTAAVLSTTRVLLFAFVKAGGKGGKEIRVCVNA